MKRFFWIFAIIISACSTQDSPDESEAKLLKANDPSAFSAEDVFVQQEKGKNPPATEAYNAGLPAMDQDSFEAFQRYQAWRKIYQPTGDAQKDYQAYLRYQQQQSQ